ncbi:MAG TPA: polyketide synthase, partial [Pyrinomonadaceae bacterium]|nr:polyketide synthase [Pyrinomonadaceae bacterium]
MSDSEVDESRTGLEVAVVGMAGRFPGAATLEEFWRNLRDGVESITSYSREEQLAAGVAPAMLDHPQFVNAGATLEGVEMFDAGFFGFSHREAELMDPQHRIFLECAWEALEHAGYDPEQYEGAVGVFASESMNTYLLFNLSSNRELIESESALQGLIRIGNGSDTLPTVVSYKLNLQGPSLNVQSA